MTLVAGIDSSTQSCKVLVCDAETGDVIRQGKAPHPDGTEIDPTAWESAAHSAIEQAGGLGDVAAVSVGAQQHGMLCLDSRGRVIRQALLWNDVRSANAALDLVTEFGGPAAWADAVGVVPLAAITALVILVTAVGTFVYLQIDASHRIDRTHRRRHWQGVRRVEDQLLRAVVDTKIARS